MTGSFFQQFDDVSLMAALTPSVIGLSARILALIREATQFGRNSFELWGFRRGSPTIGTDTIDISHCCYAS
jgi:hypothetical protein